MRLMMLSCDPTAFDVDKRDAETSDENSWRGWTTGDNHILRAAWGVFQDTTCVGMVAAHREHTECHIGALWVRPENRLAGTARLLLDAAETWACDVRCLNIFLGVADWNTVRSYYERRHYKPTGRAIKTRWGHYEIEMTKPVGT
jgi:GNAT superfamily N-acetyltransferase